MLSWKVSQAQRISRVRLTGSISYEYLGIYNVHLLTLSVLLCPTLVRRGLWPVLLTFSLSFFQLGLNRLTAVEWLGTPLYH